MDLKQAAREIAQNYGIDPNLFVRLVQAESSFIPDRVSEAGAVGLTQIMKETGLDPGYDVEPIADRTDPLENLRFGAEYYKALKDKFGSDELALMAYHAGPGNTEKIINQEKSLGPKTDNYITTILGKPIDADKWGIRRRKVVTTTDQDVPIEKEDLGALNALQGGTTTQPTKVDPALLSLLYFSKMGEVASQPGATLLGSIAGSAIAPAEYLADLKKPPTGTPGGNVAKVLAQWDNGLVQYLTRDGNMVVKFLNKVYTDPVQIEKLIAKANKEADRVDLQSGLVEAEVAGLTEGAKGAFSIAKDQASEGLKLITRLERNIGNYQEGISAIDEGAQSGFFVSLLPSIRQASIELDNVVNRLGLDVVGSVTFGALSEGELRMAMSTAAPTNMRPEYLKKWFQERIKSKNNVLKVTQDMVRFLSGGDKTMKDYYERKDTLQQEGKWRETLGLDDVDLSTLSDADAVVAEATSNNVSEISAEDQALIDKIQTMNREDLNAFDHGGRSTSVLAAWIARSALLNELEQ
jgi:hypothetical protein